MQSSCAPFYFNHSTIQTSDGITAADIVDVFQTNFLRLLHIAGVWVKVVTLTVRLCGVPSASGWR
jgi:hypothetical protein